MENKSRKPFLNLIFTILHWILAEVLCLISLVIQFSFLKDTGETYSGIIFSGKVYEINYLMFVLGTALFLAGFYIILKKCLLVDWNAFWGKNFLWKVLYLIIALAVTFVVCIVFDQQKRRNASHGRSYRKILFDGRVGRKICQSLCV